jgi:hypothetical protein
LAFGILEISLGHIGSSGYRKSYANIKKGQIIGFLFGIFTLSFALHAMHKINLMYQLKAGATEGCPKILIHHLPQKNIRFKNKTSNTRKFQCISWKKFITQIHDRKMNDIQQTGY